MRMSNFRHMFGLVAVAVLVAVCCLVTQSLAAESPVDKERIVLDDMEDISDWYNGSPEETTLSASDQFAKQGRTSLKFANRVDHTKGEKNYPIGWPRTGKDLKKLKRTDWSSFDYFECWIYATTSRTSLPKSPLSIGFYHSGPKRSTHVTLDEVTANQWAKIVIPIADVDEPEDVQRIQFNISESDYKHGDQVDFFIDDVVLTRLTHPIIAECHADRRLHFSSDRLIRMQYDLIGYRERQAVKVSLAVGQNETAVNTTTDHVNAVRELTVALKKPLLPGTYWARLSLLNSAGIPMDSEQTTFRVIDGPFQETAP